MIVLKRRSVAGILILLLMAGCFTSPEERWAAFDARRRQEIGIKTKHEYLQDWGKPAKREVGQDGNDIWIWEWTGYGGAQGWRKKLSFSPDGVLKDFSREYWGLSS